MAARREPTRSGSAAASRDAPALSGLSIVLTGHRRSAEFAQSFTRRGASVLHAPVLQLRALSDDTGLVEATRRAIAEPPDVVIVTTAVGILRWLEIADLEGLGSQLRAVLNGARLLARGPKARGALRSAGLAEEFVAASETTAEVVDRLLDGGVSGLRVTLQMHGGPDGDVRARLEPAGARVETLRVYQWAPSPAPEAVQRAIQAVCNRTTDAVVFTSAPGSQAFLDLAEAAGRTSELLAALASDVLPAAVGPVTAEPLRAAGLDPLVPERFRLGALVRALTERLADGRAVDSRDIATEGGLVRIRGNVVNLDGEAVHLSPVPMALLRVLARRPGEVVDRHRLLDALVEARDLHAVEVAVARLRTCFGQPGIVETVIGKGYRLATVADPVPVDGRARHDAAHVAG